MSKILVVTYGGGHVNMMLPVIKQLQLLGYQVTVLGLTTAGQVLQRNGIEYIGFKDLLGYSAHRSQAIEMGLALVPEAVEGAPVSHEETVAYHGLSYQELCQQEGERQAEKLYKQARRQAFCPVLLLQRFIEHLAPDVVVTTNSPRAEQAALTAASGMGIPTVAVVDMFAIRSFKWLLPTASRICVLNNAVQKFLQEKGASTGQVVVTGNPSFDGFVKQAQQQDLSAERKRFTILWASQFEPEYFAELDVPGNPMLPRQIETQLIRAVDNNAGWHLIARNHPNEPPITYPSQVEVSPSSEDLMSLLSRVDVVVTMTSTVGFQGLICGAKLITVGGSAFEALAPFHEIVPCVKLSRATDLESTLLELQKQSSMSELPYAEADATGRIVQTIVNQAQVC